MTRSNCHRRVIETKEPALADLVSAITKAKGTSPVSGDLPYQCDACSTPGYGSDAPCRCTTI